MHTHTPIGYEKVCYLYNEAFWSESRITSQDDLKEDTFCLGRDQANVLSKMIEDSFTQARDCLLWTSYKHKKREHQAYFISFTKYGREMVGLESNQESNIKTRVIHYHSSKWSPWSLIIVRFPCERTLW